MADERAILEIHELTRRAFLEGNADLVAPFIGDSELAISDGQMREETRDAWHARFAAVLAAMHTERWEDRQPPLWGMSQDGTMAWLVELVDSSGIHGDRAFTTSTARLTVFERREGRWRRIVYATTPGHAVEKP